MRHLYRFLSFIIITFERACWFVKKKAMYSKLGKVGKDVYIAPNYAIPCPGRVFIGDDVYIGDNVRLSSDNSDIHIGNHVMFGPNVRIHGGDHRYDVVGKFCKSLEISDKNGGGYDQDVWIEDDTWIGDGVIILKGVRVARGCIIGAGSVISKSTEPYDIVVGVNKVIGKRFTPDEIQYHENELYR